VRLVWCSRKQSIIYTAPITNLYVQCSRFVQLFLICLEPLVLAFIAEAEEASVYMSPEMIRHKMADLMFDKPFGDERATFSAASRGERDEAGELVVLGSDFDHGVKWTRNFFARHADATARAPPSALDTDCENRQAVDNFAWWYLFFERFLAPIMPRSLWRGSCLHCHVSTTRHAPQQHGTEACVWHSSWEVYRGGF